MGRIVAIGGGKLNEIKLIHEYALELVSGKRPKVLFIPTASNDNEEYIRDFNKAFKELNCDVETLLLTRRQYTDQEIDELFKWMDLVYVGGGNAVFMMNLWNKYGIVKKLKDVFTADSAVLVGQGSGSISYFYCGYSNGSYTGGGSDWQLIWTDKLIDLHHVAICPHYNDDIKRNFDKRLLEKDVPGIGLEDCTAFVQVGEKTEYIGCREDAKAYYILYFNGGLVEKEIDVRYLTSN